MLVVKLIQSKLFPPSEPYYPRIEDCYEGQLLMKTILENFNINAEKINGKFVILQLPNEMEMTSLKLNGSHPNQAYLSDVFKEYNVCRSDHLLLEQDLSELFSGHYTSFTNKIIGEHFAKWLISNYDL